MYSSLIPLLCFGLLTALPLAAAPQSIPLWTGAAPGALGTAPKDIPTITIYAPDPDKASGAAFVICPGGGYGHLAPHEGEGYALWFAQHGITGIVLKYRLATDGYHHPCMIEDAARAVRLVRANAAAWKIDTDRIGIIGSSAGGHLAATLLTHFDAGNPNSPDPVERQSSRPDLGVLCYAVITMVGPHVQGGSRDNLLGKNPSPQLLEDLSAEKQVKANTPPCFVWQTYEDKTVVADNSINFVSALLAKGIPFEYHVYEKGNHGIGMNKGLPAGQYYRWTNDLLAWLTERGWLAHETAGAIPAPANSQTPK